MYARYYVIHDTGYNTGMSVPHALLALLSEGPKYGLRLREEFEARTGEVWPLNVGLALAVDAELFRLDAVTRWLDAADARLARAAAEPPAPVLVTPPQLRRMGARR